MRQLVINKIRKDFIRGLKYIPFCGQKWAGIRENEDGTYISLEQLDYLVANVTDDILLKILDSQSCDKYR